MNIVINDVCVGCGICSTVCPGKCIYILYNEYKEYIPVVDNNKCTGCQKCIEYCTMSKKNREKKDIRLGSFEDKYYYGIENAKYYIGTHTDFVSVMKSASAGFVTYFAKTLLNENKISAVINAKCIFASNGSEHYTANICRTTEELDDSASSAYGPIHFDTVLEEFRNKDESILIIGIPCVIWGMKKLFLNHPEFKNNKIITLALSCSHNVNGQFTDCIADYYNMGSRQYKINYRTKDIRMENQSNFYISLIDNNGVEIRQNRFKSIWTLLWREYFFSFRACDKCNDFWGYDADICVKDAWGIGNKFQYGSNMIIVKNNSLFDVLSKMNDFFFEEIPVSKVIHAQESSVLFKQVDYLQRQSNNSEDHSKIITDSKKVYMEYGISGILNLIHHQEKCNE